MLQCGYRGALPIPHLRCHPVTALPVGGHKLFFPFLLRHLGLSHFPVAGAWEGVSGSSAHALQISFVTWLPGAEGTPVSICAPSTSPICRTLSRALWVWHQLGETAPLTWRCSSYLLLALTGPGLRT